MLQVVNISKSYGSEVVLENVSFVVNPGECAGLIGPNGSGKSTLLRIIARVEEADTGHVVLGSGASAALIPQGFEVDSAHTLGEAVRRGLADHANAYERLLDVEKKMARERGPELDALIEQYGLASDEFASLGGYDVEHRTAAILHGLGLGAIPDDTPLSTLSGGQRTRAGLASIIVRNPDVLLLDEPTNHLDIQALEWLEEYLSTYIGAAVIVSHDRTFLDGAVTGILELNGLRSGIADYPGSYSDYSCARKRELEKQTAAWKDQEAERRRIERDISLTKQTALRTETSTTHDFYRGRAKKVARKAKVRERRLERMLSSPDRVERPKAGVDHETGLRQRPTRWIPCADAGRCRSRIRWAMAVPGTSILNLERGERIALLGPNGCGKSTLLKLVMGHETPAAGSARIGQNIRVGYMPQDQAGLDWNMSPLEMVRQATDITETEARTMLHLYLFQGDEALLPAGNLSYGQRSRLLFARLVLQGANFLVLDEPMNHLDIPSRERFEEALAAFPGTALMVSHDRAFIDTYATGVWAVEDGTIRRYPDRGRLGRRT